MRDGLSKEVRDYNATDICECSDPGCWCNGHCARAALILLYRVDMNDESGVYFCEQCADDALDSGLFSHESPESSHSCGPEDYEE
jgi:hypothetical protein